MGCCDVMCNDCFVEPVAFGGNNTGDVVPAGGLESAKEGLQSSENYFFFRGR